MTFAELCVAVHDWMRRLPPAQVREAIKRQLDSEEGVEGLRRGFPVDAAWVMISLGLGPGMRPVVFRELRGEAPAAPRGDEAPETAIASEKPKAEPEAAERMSRRGSRGRPSERALALVRDQLKHGPKPAAQIEAAAEAAAIPERSLIAAASSLGVRTQRGQWWIPG
jgi:hypothetical protein